MKHHTIIFNLEDTIINNNGILFDGIKEILDQCKKQNIACGLISFRDNADIIGALRYQKIDSYFEHIIFPDENTNFPPALLLKYVLLTSKKTKECIFIGNTQQAYLAAKGAGMKFGFAEWNSDQINSSTMNKFTIRLKKPNDILTYQIQKKPLI
ncbi:MAG: HAD family hydrolase [Brevinema sp.]